MASITDIVAFCDSVLTPKSFSDYCHNGLQVGDGQTSVKKIALGVTASLNFLEQSAQWGADMCLCHHGVIFGKIQKIDDILYRRIQTLLQHNMGLVAYHLPLDAHPLYGNNIAICDMLGITNTTPTDIGFTGDLVSPVRFTDFVHNVQKTIAPTVSFAEQNGREMVSRVCVISGSASDYSALAISAGADTFITGEMKEHAVHEMRERGLNIIAAGHYNTEVFGVQRLGKAIEKEFGVETAFIAEDCSV